MAISLEKGQKISLEKTNGDSLKEFCVGVNWGAIEKSGGFFGFGKKW
jgi:tellurium resistance protein TerZ